MSFYTEQQVRDAAAEIIERMPDANNPWSRGHVACLYTSPADRDRHCIAGQIAADLGWRVPGPEFIDDAGEAAHVYEWPVDDGAVEFLMAIQREADRNEGQTRWGDIDIDAIDGYEPPLDS